MKFLDVLFQNDPRLKKYKEEKRLKKLEEKTQKEEIEKEKERVIYFFFINSFTKHLSFAMLM